jgi:hypothetical protein
VESVSEHVIRQVIEGDGIGLAVSDLVCEGQPVRDVVAFSPDVLGAQALPRFCHQEGDLACDGLDWLNTGSPV